MFFCIAQKTIAQIKINEYSVSNTNNFPGTSFVDNTGSRSDWVEFFNTTASAVSLSGWNLSDNPNNLTKFSFPTTAAIPANGFLRVWCSGKGASATAGINIHTNFKLTQCEGDWIILSNGGTITDSLQLRKTKSNHSRGRKPDGTTTWKLFTTGTPGATNNSALAYDGYVATPVLSLGAGFYSGAQSVSISCATPSTTIYYTINSAEPTIASPVYASAVTISTTTVLRALAKSTNTLLLESFMETNTYFIGENINAQYGVVSISGGSGLTGLMAGAQTNPKVHFEYFNGGQFKTETYGLADKHGNDSWAFDQRGIDFETEDDYGYNNALKYQFFTDPKQGYSNRKKFQHVILKAGASDNFPGDATVECHMRDAFVQTYSFRKELELDGRRNKHSIVFVNGQYWGIYELREAFEEDYTDYYYKQPDIMELKYWGSYVNNPPTAWQNDWANLYNFVMSNSMTNAANYAYVDSALSFKSLIDYMIYNSYVVNTDFINWNSAWWRGTDLTQGKHKWRYYMWDMDNVYDLGENFSGIPTTDMTASPCDYTNVFQNAGPQEGHPDILDKLLTNPDFKSMYITRYADLLNSAFNCDSIIEHYNHFKNILTPEMPRHIARWGSGSTIADWQANMTRLQTKIQQRCSYIESTIESCYNVVSKPLMVNVVPAGAGNVKLNSIWLNNFGWTGNYFSGVSMTFEAAAYNSSMYEFDYWEFNNHTPSPNSNSDTVTINYATQDTVIAHFKLKNNNLPLVVDVVPTGAGNVSLNNVSLNTFEYNGSYAPNTTMTFVATPYNASQYTFDHWEFSHHTPTPNALSNSVTITYIVADTAIAHFKLNDVIPPPITPTITSEEGTELFFPTAFTPNGDGKNDVLYPLGGKSASNVSFELWNRWGEMVFKSNDVTVGWDGYYKGVQVPVGVYSYYVTYTNWEGDDKVLKGSITLIR